jgi:hypothetical protein
MSAARPGPADPGEAGLEEQIASWSAYVRGRTAIGSDGADELETHLRDEIDELAAAGLTDGEAFLVAVGRIGRLDDVAREFAREHSGRLWKQLVLGDASARGAARSGLGAALALAVGAGLAAKLPALWTAPGAATFGLLDPNLPLLVLPFLGAWFAWRHRPPASVIVVVAAVYAVAALALNLYPFQGQAGADTGGMTLLLAAIHLPVLLWLMLAPLAAGGDWRSDTARMDFVRFTGEWFVYYVLIALGGGVLAALTAAVFGAVGMDATEVIAQWVLPCGAAGAVVVAAWLVEAKQSVIENIAPVLTKVFTPLFAVMLLAFAATTIWQPNVLQTDRELLIVFDAVLVVVVGLLLYAISARDPVAPTGWFDRLQAVLVGSAILVDAIVLVAMVARIGAFGFSANKLASLGLNAILLVNLAWSLVLLVRALRGRSGHAALERWQMACVPVYAAWAAVVVFVFPPLFGFA